MIAGFCADTKMNKQIIFFFNYLYFFIFSIFQQNHLT